MLLLILSPIFLQSVSAIETESIDANINIKQDTLLSEQTNYQNLAKEIQTERNVLESDHPIFNEGVFYGSYSRSSLFELAYSGQYITLYSNFLFGSDIIMNGVSDWWLRIPVNPSSIKFEFNESITYGANRDYTYPLLYINDEKIPFSDAMQNVHIGYEGIYISGI